MAVISYEGTEVDLRPNIGSSEILTPIMQAGVLSPNNAKLTTTANLGNFLRVIAGRTGSVKDLYAFGGNETGSLLVGVYKPEEEDKKLKRLAYLNAARGLETGYCGARVTADWHGEEEASVKAGESLFLAVVTNSSLSQIYGTEFPNLGSGPFELPPKYLGYTGAPVLGFAQALGSFTLPATVNVSGESLLLAPVLIARVG